MLLTAGMYLRQIAFLAIGMADRIGTPKMDMEGREEEAMRGILDQGAVMTGTAREGQLAARGEATGVGQIHTTVPAAGQDALLPSTVTEYDRPNLC